MPKDPKRHVLISDDYDGVAFTKARRAFKCSEVTASHSILGQTIKEYSRRMGDPNIDWV